MRIIILTLIVLSSLHGVSYSAQNYLPALPHEASLIKGLQTIDQGKWSLGQSIISKASGSLAGKTFYWLKYSSNNGGDGANWYRISRFIKSHSNWPDLISMKENAEQAMPSNLPSNETIRWFDEYPPVSELGRKKYLNALEKSGQKTLLSKELARIWTQTLFGDKEHNSLVVKYSPYISKSLHKKRLNFLMANSYYDTAISLSSHIGSGEKALAIAVKALSKSRNNVTALINAVPRSLKSNPALLYERIKWRRKKNLNSGTIELLNKAPSMEKWMVEYNWWKERHIIIRRLIEGKNYAQAYKLASHHKQTKGLGLSEAEFLSGWLALRFVNKPHQSYQHFKNLYMKVKTPISKSRGAYWAGRAATSIGEKEKALKWYSIASYWHTTYYGQRAYEELQKLKLASSTNSISIKRPAPIIIDDSTWDKWTSSNRVQVMRLLYQGGLEDRSLQFLANMLNDKNNKAQDFMALAKITRLIGFHYGEVKVAKKAAYNSVILVSEDKSILGYPLLNVKNSNKNIGLSHIHAITRQESEFNSKAESSAGAKGYMQLMPRTAKQVARGLKVKHNKSWLILRPEHNILLGSSYLDGLMKNNKGNLILSSASYNAGPGNVSKWLKIFGDPRSSSVNAIDWVELIPFSETRNYVQRVSEVEHLYKTIILK